MCTLAALAWHLAFHIMVRQTQTLIHEAKQARAGKKAQRPSESVTEQEETKQEESGFSDDSLTSESSVEDENDEEDDNQLLLGQEKEEIDIMGDDTVP